MRDTEGKTALHTAARKGYRLCSALLVEKAADVNCIDEVPYVICNFSSVLLILINFTPLVSLDVKVGWTPLHEATSEGNSAIVRILLAKNAIVDVPDKDGL